MLVYDDVTSENIKAACKYALNPLNITGTVIIAQLDETVLIRCMSLCQKCVLRMTLQYTAYQGPLGGFPLHAIKGH